MPKRQDQNVRAIIAYNTDSELAPPLGSPQRGAYYQYLFWMASTLQEAANRWAHPEHYIDLEGFDDSRHDTKESLSLIVEKAGSELKNSVN